MKNLPLKSHHAIENFHQHQWNPSNSTRGMHHPVMNTIIQYEYLLQDWYLQKALPFNLPREKLGYQKFVFCISPDPIQ